MKLFAVSLCRSSMNAQKIFYDILEKGMDERFKSQPVEEKEKFKQSNRDNFSKKNAKERQLKEKSHLNRRSQVFIKKRK